MNARDVVLDPRVRLKCMVPQCANYGRNLMCPPNVMDLDAFSAALDQYTDAILVQCPIPIGTDFMKEFEGVPLEDIESSRTCWAVWSPKPWAWDSVSPLRSPGGPAVCATNAWARDRRRTAAIPSVRGRPWRPWGSMCI